MHTVLPSHSALSSHQLFTGAPLLSAACSEAMTGDLPHLGSHPTSPKLHGGRPARAPPASQTLIDIPLSADHAVPSPDPDGAVLPSWQTSTEPSRNNGGGGSRDGSGGRRNPPPTAAAAASASALYYTTLERRRDVGGGGRRSVIELLRLFFSYFQTLLIRVWETCKKSEQLLPITNPPPPTATAAASSAVHYTLEQSTNDTLKTLSKAKYMVFPGFVAFLSGLLSLDLGSKTTPTTTALIKSFNFTILTGSLCIIMSIALPFILPRHYWLAKPLFYIATGLLLVCMVLCSLLVHVSL